MSTEKGGRITRADIENAAMALGGHQPYRAKERFAHPEDRKHLASHGGGDVGCETCRAIWRRMP